MSKKTGTERQPEGVTVAPEKMTLKGLLAHRDELDRQIKTTAEDESNERRADIIANEYVRAVCLSCRGTGKDLDDVKLGPCLSCNGDGFKLVRRFNSKGLYELEYDSRCIAVHHDINCCSPNGGGKVDVLQNILRR